MQKREKKFAFTLAEALITLTVLGIIAALTIPGLKKFSQKETAVMQLKKAYTTMNGVLDYVIADNITMDISKIGGDEFFTNYMIPRLNVVKQCSATDMGDCFPASVDGLDLTPANAVILSDGSVVGNNGMDFIIDINGKQEPNVMGADVFQYRLEKVKGDNQVAMNMSYGSLFANIFNAFTPAAYAFNQNIYMDAITGGGGGCPSCGWCGGTERICASIPKDPVLPFEPSKPNIKCELLGTCTTIPQLKPDLEEPVLPVTPDPKPETPVTPETPVVPETPETPTAPDTTVTPETPVTPGGGSSSGGTPTVPETPTTPETPGGGGGGGGTAVTPDDSDATFDSATNTAGWRFVPIGKTADIMNNNWKIKAW